MMYSMKNMLLLGLLVLSAQSLLVQAQELPECTLEQKEAARDAYKGLQEESLLDVCTGDGDTDEVLDIYFKITDAESPIVCDNACQPFYRDFLLNGVPYGNCTTAFHPPVSYAQERFISSMAHYPYLFQRECAGGCNYSSRAEVVTFNNIVANCFGSIGLSDPSTWEVGMCTATPECQALSDYELATFPDCNYYYNIYEMQGFHSVTQYGYYLGLSQGCKDAVDESEEPETPSEDPEIPEPPVDPPVESEETEEPTTEPETSSVSLAGVSSFTLALALFLGLFLNH